MPYRWIPAVLAAGLLALPAEAGLVYRYTTKTNVALAAKTSGGRVWMDEGRERIELDRDPENPMSFDLIIRQGGRTTLINRQNHTYFRREGDFRNWSIFHLPTENERIDGKPEITHQQTGAGPALGEHQTTKHEIRIRYRLRGEIAGERLRGVVDGTITVHTAATLPRGGRSAPHTKFADLDAQLARLYESFDGMVVHEHVSISRTIEDGARITEFTTFTIDELNEADVPDRLFAIPEGFTYQEPVYGAPGD